MKIVQSLWSCNKDLLSANFGWLTPQHHLTAWTLSCLRLHEYYSDLHLFTDQHGYDILIKHLKLPYKNVHIVFDQIDNRHESNFAIAKILTYAAMREPFIHVDGDVFIWERFSNDIESAALIAQNPEKGTAYYRDIMDALTEKLSYIPDYLNAELSKVSIPSYNAGILGGNDIEFLNKYANSGLELIEKNCVETGNYKLPGNFNILFEQILFRALSDGESKKVTCLIPGTIDDNGYSDALFANFSSVPSRLKYLHLIGSKKRDREICDLLSRTLLQQYPEYFYRVLELFRSEHPRFYPQVKTIFPEKNNSGTSSPKQIGVEAKNSKNILKQLGDYEQTLAKLIDNWKQIDFNFLHAIEQIPANGFNDFFDSEKLQSIAYIERNPYIVIIEDSFSWPPETKNMIASQFALSDPDETFGIACIPQLFFNGCSQVVIDELDFNILTLLEKPMLLNDMLQRLQNCFADAGDGDISHVMRELTLIRLKRLFLNKCIFVKSEAGFPKNQSISSTCCMVN